MSTVEPTNPTAVSVSMWRLWNATEGMQIEELQVRVYNTNLYHDVHEQKLPQKISSLTRDHRNVVVAAVRVFFFFFFFFF